MSEDNFTLLPIARPRPLLVVVSPVPLRPQGSALAEDPVVVVVLLALVIVGGFGVCN